MIEAARRGLHAVPVGAQADELERVREQRAQRRLRVHPQRLRLPRTEADAERSQTARRDRLLTPAIRQRPRGTHDPERADAEPRGNTAGHHDVNLG